MTKKRSKKSEIPRKLRAEADQAIDFLIAGLQDLKGKTSHVSAEFTRSPEYVGEENGMKIYKPGPTTYCRITFDHRLA